MFYIEQNNKIVLFEEDKQKLQDTLSFMPQYSVLEIMEVPEGKTIVDFELITVEEAEEKAQQNERERISHLTCTKRVFALMLQKLGINYTQLKELIATNEQAQLEWDLCVELERSNPLLDVMALQLGIDSETLDKLFMFANGEITEEEFLGVNEGEME